MTESLYEGARRMSSQGLTGYQASKKSSNLHAMLAPLKTTLDSYGVSWSETKQHLGAHWEHYGAPGPAKNPKPRNDWLVQTHDHSPEKFHYMMQNIISGDLD